MRRPSGKKLILAPEEDACVSDIVCLTARISDKFVQIKHPDVLGALMNLDRQTCSQFGDLWVEPGRIAIYTSEELADYVCMNLTRIDKLSIRLERSSMMYEPVVKKQALTVIVTALRLGTGVIAGLCRMSRAKAQDWIRAQRVSVNHKILDECDFLCHNEDTVSGARVRAFCAERPARSDPQRPGSSLNLNSMFKRRDFFGTGNAEIPSDEKRDTTALPSTTRLTGMSGKLIL